MSTFLQAVISGATLGSLYALVGLGFVIIYITTRTVNFAHGPVLMLGAVIGLHLHVDVGVPFWQTFLLVLVACAVLGAATERITFRPLVRAPVMSVILATAALGTILQSGVRIVQGEQLSYFPPVVSTTPLRWGQLSVTPLQLFIIGACLALVAGFWVLLRRTRIGLALRAAAENREAATLMGIDTSRLAMLTWALSGALAGAAGLLIAPLVLITPDMGVIANTAFIGAVLGGFASVPGSVAGGLLLGVLETLIGVYVTTAYKNVLVFLLLIAILWVRPAGIFGRPETGRV